jgi:S-(hydroxymethyl)glutathione dehydrogenase/alcohol dehydrogenase
VATGLGAVLNVAQVEDGATAAVFGINTAGLAVVEALRISNASRIIALDMSSTRLDQARAWGATDCINLSSQVEHPSAVIGQLLGSGVDYAFDCIGSAAVSSAALESCNEGWGTTVLLGAGSESSAPAASITQSQILKGKVLKGALLGGYRGRAEIPLLVEKYMLGQFRLDGLVRDTVPLSKIQQAITHAQKAEDAARVIIKFVPDNRPFY